MHRFFGTPFPQDIESSSPHNDFFGNVFSSGSIFFNKTSNSVKLLLLHPNLAFKLTKANTADNLMKVVYVKYNGFFESLSILSYKGACAC